MTLPDTKTPAPLTWLLAALLLLAGCSTTADPADPPTDWGPDEQLAWWLEAWYRTQDEKPSQDGVPEAVASSEDGSAEDSPPEGLSPARVRMGIRSLAMKYPGHVPTLVTNGAVSLAWGDRPNAEHWLDSALDIDPAHVDAASLRARLAVDAGNLAGARRVLSRAILLRPDAAELREAHAGVLYLQGDLENAWRELEAAERLAGRDARNAYHRGLIRERASDLEGALAWYRWAAQTDPKMEQAWQRWLALEALGGSAGVTSAGDTAAARP